jgi:hypothetical protein
MIIILEKLEDYNLKIVTKRDERYFHDRNIVAVEMVKSKDYYYKIDKVIDIAEIKYKYKEELLEKMNIIVNNIANYLNLKRERIIFNDSSVLNIELNVEVEIEKFEQKPELEFYGFYEISSEKIFMLTFKDQLKNDIEYFVMMNTLFSSKFPFTAQGENEFNI